MMVSHIPSVLPPRASAFFINLRILPLGVWIPNLAAFAGMTPFATTGVVEDPSLGFCRTAKTNVLFMASFAHWGCVT